MLKEKKSFSQAFLLNSVARRLSLCAKPHVTGNASSEKRSFPSPLPDVPGLLAVLSDGFVLNTETSPQREVLSAVFRT